MITLENNMGEMKPDDIHHGLLCWTPLGPADCCDLWCFNSMLPTVDLQCASWGTNYAMPLITWSKGPFFFFTCNFFGFFFTCNLAAVINADTDLSPINLYRLIMSVRQLIGWALLRNASLSFSFLTGDCTDVCGAPGSGIRGYALELKHQGPSHHGEACNV